ncbi:hypothetical protein MKZ38_000234 [Zalerion maritima]|uniref:C2H2-type domain-containing protein n=1 Tax=Zalerion maritima TaxID=339359 RepID=A0AAD5RG78_9PEZI|nr:hypothetical protein MKZ38_000234 [Zalerion maritima]
MARLVTVDIKGFSDAQQAKILRALCRKDEALREKVAHMLQIAYGQRLSAAVSMEGYEPQDGEFGNQQQQQQYQRRAPGRASQPSANQTQDWSRQSTRALPEIPASAPRASGRRSGSDSSTATLSTTIPSRSTSASSTEPPLPCVEDKPAAESAPAEPSAASAGRESSTCDESTTPTPPPPASILRHSISTSSGGGRVDSRTVGPHVPERVQEFEVREKWVAARARLAAAAAAAAGSAAGSAASTDVGASVASSATAEGAGSSSPAKLPMSGSQSVRTPKGPRARPSPGPRAGNPSAAANVNGSSILGGYLSDGPELSQHRRQRTPARGGTLRHGAMAGGAGASPKTSSPRRPTARENAQRYICGMCEQVFTNQTNSSHSCRYHHGSLELDMGAPTWGDWHPDSDGCRDTPDNRSLFPDGFRWTCCNRSGSRGGCQRTSHCVDPARTAGY